MKYGLFVAASRINYLLIEEFKSFTDMIIALSNAVTRSLLRIIDYDRFEHVEQTIEQIDEISELQVLQNINQVRNEAIEVGSWNEEHEGKLNFLGNMLCNEYDWDVEEVERYLHEVIATGPSLADD